MTTNAYVLEWAMNDYRALLTKLKGAGFAFEKEPDKEHIRVNVPFSRKEEFADIVQPHINAPYNYVDAKYPEENMIYAVFGAKRIEITNLNENEAAKKWAINLGLPPKQADWSHWFK